MSKNRKSDKGRFKDKRGLGRGAEYHSWIKGHEFSSSGIIHRLIGWIHRRLYQFFSNEEYYAFLIFQFNDKVIDIREQVPLLPIELTISIANELGIKHPAEYNQVGKETVRSTDLLITVKEGDLIRDKAISIKLFKDLDDLRTRQLLKLEEKYWEAKGVSWCIMTEKQISKVMAENISIIYDNYFWNEDNNFSSCKVKIYVEHFKDCFVKSNMDLNKTLAKFEEDNSWGEGEGLNFLKFMLAKKIIKTNMYIPFNFDDMKIVI